jgi:polyisoprenoid-binding protein YceI
MRYVTRTKAATLPLVVGLLFAGGGHAAETLKITPECGVIEFVGSKVDDSHVGGFKKFSGTVKLVADDLSASRLTLEIDTGSLWADNPKLAAHLRNEDFFYVDMFPKALFRTTAIRKALPKDRKKLKLEDITHLLSGELTLLGVSKKIEVPVKMEVNEKVFHIVGAYTLDRTQFGMDYGLGKVHKEVPVDFALKIPRKKKP